MSFWDELTQGIANAADDIRHKVVEEPWYGREVTGNIELKEPEPKDMGTLQQLPEPEKEMER